VKKYSKVLFLLVIAMVWLLTTAFVFLQPADLGDLGEVLAWLALGPGAVYVAGRAMSILLEKVPGWGTAVPESVRPFIVLALSGGLMFGSQFLLGQEAVLAQIAPIYKQIVLLVTAWFATQQQYLSMKADGTRGTRPR
jgi:hypothetical protein